MLSFVMENAVQKIPTRKHMAISIIDVTRYILQTTQIESSMKLQKLCYYAQAWSLAWDNTSLFMQDFEAWESGPVCIELFNWTRDIRLDSGKTFSIGTVKLSERQKEIIDEVVVYYGEHDAWWLSQLTMMEDPWRIAKNRILHSSGTKCDYIISKESIRDYYQHLA